MPTEAQIHAHNAAYANALTHSPPGTPRSAQKRASRRSTKSVGSQSSFHTADSFTPAHAHPTPSCAASLSQGSFHTASSSGDADFHSIKSGTTSEAAKSAAPSASASVGKPSAEDLAATIQQNRQKLTHARLRIAAQVFGATFLVATLVTTAVLCPPALVLVAPVCAFAGHALFGAFGKTLREKQHAHLELASAERLYQQHFGSPSPLPAASLQAPSLARNSTAGSQDLDALSDDDDDAPPATPREGSVDQAAGPLAAPVSSGLLGAKKPPSAAQRSAITQSYNVWNQTLDAESVAQKDLAALTAQRQQAGLALEAHLQAATGD